MKRHRTDFLSMFSGVVFLGLGGVFVTGRVDVNDLGAEWLWPIPLILAGLFIFIAAFRGEPNAAADGDVALDLPGDAGDVSDEQSEEARVADAVQEEPVEEDAEPPD